MLFKREYLCVFLAVGLIFFIKPALAENPVKNDKPWEKFSLKFGYFISTVDSDLRLGSGVGLSVDVEELLGLDTTNSVFRIDSFWRFTENRRHRLDLTWFSFRRDGSNIVGQDIPIKDDDGNEITIPAGSHVDGKFNLDIYKAGYSYSFIQDDRMDLAFVVGLYVMPIEIGLNSTGVVNVDEKETFIAPFPTFGLRADFAITPKWFLRSGFEVFYLEIDKFTGTLYETFISVEYLPWKNFGFPICGSFLIPGAYYNHYYK